MNLDKPLKWEELQCFGKIPPVRWGHSMTVIGDKIYLFGGRGGRFSKGYTYHPELHVLSIGEYNVWDTVETGGQKPHPALFVTLNAIQQNKFIVFGGQDDSRAYNAVFVLEHGDSTWKSPAIKGTPPVPRFCHFASEIPGANQFLVFGGNNDNSKFYNDLFILDLDKLEWTQPKTTGTSPSPRDDYIAAVLGEKLWVFGGQGPNDQVFYSLNLKTLEWKTEITTGEAPTCRRGATATPIFDRFFVVYGGVSETTVYNDTYLFDTVTMTWNKPRVSKGSLPHPCAGHAAALLNNKFVFGGESAELFLSDILYVLDLSALEQVK